MADYTYQEAYNRAVSTNYLYNRNKVRWQFYLSSYLGGEDYRNGNYLTRYQLENDKEYQQRLLNAPLDNQCKSIISLYTSFLFRTCPQRDFGMAENDFTINDILDDADLDGRNMDAFMKDVAIWSSVFGHVWVCVSKTNVGALTRADEIAQGVRPYMSVYTPLSVLDWTWAKQANGGYALSYIKLLEEVDDTINVVKEWTLDSITTTTINVKKKEAKDVTVEPNELGRLPFVCIYAERTPVRGLGNSMISDIADQQRLIYNELSEVYASISLDTHPSLVATQDTNIQGAAAGQIITMPESMDPQLKPYVLQFQGGQIASIYDSINNRRKMIDSMANVGSVRATESTEMSGISREVEFQLLNARLSSISSNLSLGEEQIWREIYSYLGLPYDAEITYPSDFALRSVDNELAQLVLAMGSITDPVKRGWIEEEIMKCIDVEDPQHEIDELAAAAAGLPPPDESLVEED